MITLITTDWDYVTKPGQYLSRTTLDNESPGDGTIGRVCLVTLESNGDIKQSMYEVAAVEFVSPAKYQRTYNGATWTAWTVEIAGLTFDMDGQPLVNPADPTDDTMVGDRGYTDIRYVNTAGDTMTGTLNMSEQALTNPLDPVDATGVGDRGFNDNRYLQKAGGTMSGSINMNNQALTNPLDPVDDTGVGDRGYNDARYLGNGSKGEAISDPDISSSASFGAYWQQSIVGTASASITTDGTNSKNSLKITGAAGNTSAKIYAYKPSGAPLYLPIVQNEVFEWTIRIKHGGALTGNVLVSITEYDKSLASLVTTSSTIVSTSITSSFLVFSGFIKVASANAAFAVAEFSWVAATAGQIIYVDFFKMQKHNKPILGYRRVTGATTLTHQDEVLICSSASPFTVTLPLLTISKGICYTIKNAGAGAVTVDGAGAETIDGSASIVLSQYDSIDIIANTDDSTWNII